ncbi:MAG: hypothetical protein AB7K24_20420 [Gemmataceae bacterium]
MPQLVIKQADDPGPCPCAMCSEEVMVEVGPQLATPEHAPVCARCGKQQAPALQALVDLARTAERIGKIAQHTTWLPLKAHLEMAHAAEKFASSLPSQRREAS